MRLSCVKAAFHFYVKIKANANQSAKKTKRIFVSSCAYTCVVLVSVEVNPCAWVSYSYGPLCLRLCFSAFVSTLVFALVYFSVCMGSCVIALAYLSVCIDPCVCACVSQCFYGLLCLRLRLSVFVWTVVLAHAFFSVCMDSWVIALAFLSVCIDSCACACVSQCLYAFLC